MLVTILVCIVIYFIVKEMGYRYSDDTLKSKENKAIFVKILTTIGLVFGHMLKLIGFILTSIFSGINSVIGRGKNNDNQ